MRDSHKSPHEIRKLRVRFIAGRVAAHSALILRLGGVYHISAGKVDVSSGELFFEPINNVSDSISQLGEPGTRGSILHGGNVFKNYLEFRARYNAYLFGR